MALRAKYRKKLRRKPCGGAGNCYEFNLCLLACGLKKWTMCYHGSVTYFSTCMFDDTIRFRPHAKADIPYRVAWLNNPRVNRYIGDSAGKQTTQAKEEAWFAAYEKDPQKRFFTICDGEKPIGFMGLSQISKEHKNANLFLAIGDDRYRGKGIGKMAARYLVRYAFTKLHLHKVNLHVIKENTAAIACYASVGCKTEGMLEDEVRLRGKYHDLILMAMVRR